MCTKKYGSDESDVRGNSYVIKNLNISAAASRLCDKCKEVVSQSSTVNGISGTLNQSFNHAIHFTRRDSVQDSKSMSGGFEKSVCYPLETNQFDRFSVLDSSGSCTCMSSERYFQERQVSKIRLNCSYQALVDLNLNSMEKQKLWTNNLELKNGGTIMP